MKRKNLIVKRKAEKIKITKNSRIVQFYNILNSNTQLNKVKDNNKIISANFNCGGQSMIEYNNIFSLGVTVLIGLGFGILFREQPSFAA